ncbi:MAG: hypothetical protein KDH84_11990, partial [Calditrichaeota bacterium]|nr:hypothetical protein [Calditrichota bacterium]
STSKSTEKFPGIKKPGTIAVPGNEFPSSLIPAHPDETVFHRCEIGRFALSVNACMAISAARKQGLRPEKYDCRFRPARSLRRRYHI